MIQQLHNCINQLMEGTSAARWCSPWLHSNLKSQMKRHDSWGQLCFKPIGTMSCCCHFLLLYFNIPFHSWTSSLIERATQTLTFSGVSPSHGSPSPNIRNISHLPDPQHILLHDVEVHDSRQWYPETMGHVCSDSPMHTTGHELPSKTLLGAWIPIESQRMDFLLLCWFTKG